jgi:hypothetical protein
MKTFLFAVSAGCVAALVTGCASSKNDTPPIYQATPAYSPPPAYRYAPQTVSPGPNAQPPPATSAPASAPDNAGAATQAAAHTEAAPTSPGPDYIWMPGYWTVGIGGGWIWVGGHYVLRQGAAEEQLRAARGMLEQARAGVPSKAAKNIDKAIDQVNSALQVK